MKSLMLSFMLAIAAAPIAAESYMPVKDEGLFKSLVAGKELRNFFYGVRLFVFEDGRIDGSAIGRDINGTWSWQDGFFCREMKWGERAIPYNCQLVEARGDDRLRFTVDQGAGDSASFRLQ